MPATYILKCADGSFYVGSTFNLDQRPADHLSGEGAKYTSKRLPVQLAWYQEFDSVRDAYELERQLHGWSRATKQAMIDGRFDALPGLSRSHPRRDPSTSSGNE